MTLHESDETGGSAPGLPPAAMLLAIHRHLQRALDEGDGVGAVTFVVIALTGIRDLLSVRGLEVPTPHALGIPIHLVMHSFSRFTCGTPCYRRPSVHDYEVVSKSWDVLSRPPGE